MLTPGSPLQPDPDWRFAERFRELIDSYLRIGGWGFDLDPTLRLARAIHETGAQRVRFSKLESLILCMLRLHYHEQMRLAAAGSRGSSGDCRAIVVDTGDTGGSGSLAEDVVFKLRENLLLVRRQIDELNRALKDVPFGSERYQFTVEVDPAHKPFHDLVMDAGRFEKEALFGSSVLSVPAFLSYVEQADGARGLAARGEVAVYTAGFPTPRLVAALVQLAQKSNAAFQHWGDADVGGLRIWYFLRARPGCPLMLLRTTAEWVASESSLGGRPLSPMERHALVRMRQELTDDEGPDAASARALIDALLEHGVKLEQERY